MIVLVIKSRFSETGLPDLKMKSIVHGKAGKSNYRSATSESLRNVGVWYTIRSGCLEYNRPMLFKSMQV